MLPLFAVRPGFLLKIRGIMLPNSREAAFLGAARPIMGRQAAALSRMRSHVLSGFGRSPSRLAEGGGIGEDTVPYKRRIVFEDHGKQTHCLVRQRQGELRVVAAVIDQHESPDGEQGEEPCEVGAAVFDEEVA